MQAVDLIYIRLGVPPWRFEVAETAEKGLMAAVVTAGNVVVVVVMAEPSWVCEKHVWNHSSPDQDALVIRAPPLSCITSLRATHDTSTSSV